MLAGGRMPTDVRLSRPVVASTGGRLVLGLVMAAALSLLTPPGAMADALSKPSGAVREIVSERTARSSTWQMPSGAQVTQIAADPLHWKDARGAWHDYDLSLVRDRDTGVLRAEPGRLQLTLPERLGTTERNATRLVSGKDSIRAWIEGIDAEAKTSGDVAVYRDATAGIEVRMRAVASGVKEDLALAGPSTRRSLTYRLELSAGLVPRVDDRSGAVIVERGRRGVFTIPRATIKDDAGASGPPPGYRLRAVVGGWRLTVDADSDWIVAGDRQWPVVVDPTTSVTDTLSASAVCSFETAAFPHVCDATAEIGEDPTPYLGHTHTLLKFPIESNIAQDAAIASATLKLYGGNSEPSAGPWGMTVSRIMSNWAVSQQESWLMWSPEEVDSVPDAVVTMGASPSWTLVDLTALVQSWQYNRRIGSTTGVPNFGVRLNDRYEHLGKFCQSHPRPERRGEFETSGPNALRLEIVSWPSAPAGAQVVEPAEGQMTGRRVTLQAKAFDSAVTSARFQYVAGTDRLWREVPASAMRYVDNGTQPSSNELSVTAKLSRAVTWDLQSTPGGNVDGAVHVRAILESASVGGGATRVVNFRLDRRDPEKAPMAAIGPGQLNTLTGDFTLSSQDANAVAWMGSLGVSRTYHSRGVSTREAEMFGPHWTASFQADGGAMPYKNLYNYSEIRDEDVQRWVQAPQTYEGEIPLEFDDGETYSIPFSFDVDAWKPVTEVVRWEYRYAEVTTAEGGKITFKQTSIRAATSRPDGSPTKIIRG